MFGAVIVRLTALTIPAVIVSGRPNGLPIATTDWPGRTVVELPQASGWSFAAGTSTLITAMSVEASVPTSVAFVVVPSWKCTRIEVAPATTWSFVTMWPAVSTTKPDPSACACWLPPGVLNGLPKPLAPAVVFTTMSTTPAVAVL